MLRSSQDSEDEGFRAPFASSRRLVDSGEAILRGHFYLADVAAYEHHLGIGRTKNPTKKAVEKLLSKLGSAEDPAEWSRMGASLDLSSGVSHVVLVLEDGRVRVVGPKKNLKDVVWGGTEQPLVLEQRFRGCAGGLFHSLVWNDDVVLSWGYNVNASQLGKQAPAGEKPLGGQLGREGQTLAPGKIPGLSGKIEMAACGYSHSLVLTQAGVFGFGLNAEGQLGQSVASRSVATPTLIRFSEVVTMVACGAHHSLAVTEGGNLFTWGWNEYLQLGHSKSTVVQKPTMVEGLQRVTMAAGGSFHSLAATSTGKLYSWGANIDGALGRSGPPSPAQVKKLADERVVSVSCVGNRSAVCTIEGEVFVWGSFFNERFGPQKKPLLLPRSSFVYHVSLGLVHLAFLESDAFVHARSALHQCMQSGEIPELTLDLLGTLREPYFSAFQHDFVAKRAPKRWVSAQPYSISLELVANQVQYLHLACAGGRPSVKFLKEDSNDWLDVNCQEEIKVGSSVRFPITFTLKDTSKPRCMFIKMKVGKLTSFIRVTLDTSGSRQSPRPLKGTLPSKELQRSNSDLESDDVINPLMALVHSGKSFKRRCKLDNNLFHDALISNLVRYHDRKEDVNAYMMTFPLWSTVEKLLNLLLVGDEFTDFPSRVRALLSVFMRHNNRLISDQEVAAKCAELYSFPELVREVEVELSEEELRERDVSHGLFSNGRLTERGRRARTLGFEPPHDLQYFSAVRSVFEGFNVKRVTCGSQEQAVARSDVEAYLSPLLLHCLIGEGLMAPLGDGQYLESTSYYAQLYKKDLAPPSKESPAPERLAAWGKESGMQGDPRVFATQLSYIMQMLYTQVEAHHLVQREWDAPDNALGQLFGMVCNLSGWVANELLSARTESERLSRLQMAISSCVELLRMGNMSGLFAVSLGISQHVISRLNLVSQLDARTQASFERIEEIISHTRNYQSYKDALEAHEGPIVPHVGVSVTAVTFVLDGNETYVDKKINREKMHLVADVISEFLRFQDRPLYKVQFDPEAYAFFSTLKQYDMDKLYEISYKIRPK